MNGLLELLTTKEWMVMPEYVHGIRSVIQHNLTTHAALEIPEKKMGYPVAADGSGRVLGDYAQYQRVKEPFVNLEIIDGPITRNGDACSYGSRDHRDMMMMAADNPLCVGHVFIINTPGGTAWAKNDYQQAIEYAHARGQKVIAFVDGMCASAGMYLAALCDERYYMHPKNQIGCIGVMAAFYTEKDGEKCEYTNETYHELYDPESFDKNKMFRDIANDGNSDEIIEHLAQLGVEFRADVQDACPNATDEHLHGKMFDAEEVNGILMDGQKTLAEVLGLFSEATTQVVGGGDKNPVQQAVKNVEQTLSTQTKSINMKEQFPALFALLGVEDMQMEEEGSFVNMELLETLNTAIDGNQKELAAAKATVESLTTEKATLEQKLNENETAHQQALDELNAKVTEQETSIATKDETIATLTQEKEDAATQLASLNETLAERDKTIEEQTATIESQTATIADQNATITELNESAGAKGQGGGAPQNNGQGVQAPSAYSMEGAYDPSLSPAENRKRIQAYEAEQRKQLAKGA